MSGISIRHCQLAGILVLPLLIAAPSPGRSHSSQPLVSEVEGNAASATEINLPSGQRLIVDARGVRFVDAKRHATTFVAENIYSLPDIGKPDENATPALVASIPAERAASVETSAWIALRFWPPLAPTSLTDKTVTLIGPEGVVVGTVTPANNGRLVFFVPQTDLLPGSRYTLFVSGASTPNGHSLPFTTLAFSTAARNAATTAAPARGTKANSFASVDGISSSSRAATTASVLHISTGGATAERLGCDKVATQTQPCREHALMSDGAWLPGKTSSGGHWRINGLYPLVPHKGLLEGRKIPPNATGVYGQILRIDDVPVANVSVSIGALRARTDSKGVFVFANAPPGHQVLGVDGATANHANVEYGSFLIGVDIRKEKMTPMPQVLYLPRILAQDKVTIPSPTTAETVITHPEMPGLEIHIPANTVILDRGGHPLTKVAIVPIPVDRSPVPVPANFPMYFSMQPGGATVHVLSAQASGLRIVYPHESHDFSDASYGFWFYDAEHQGWQVYDRGDVTSDGRQLAANSSTGPVSFMPGGYEVSGPGLNGPILPSGSCGNNCDVTGGDNRSEGSGGANCAHSCDGGADTSGDPVDSSTGVFLLQRTDLSIDGIFPLRLTRTNRSHQTTAFAFGPGGSMNYAMYLYNPSDPITPNEIDLILANGSYIPFSHISGNLGGGGPGEWDSYTAPGRFNGAVLTVVENGLECGICIKLKDGTVYVFPSYQSHTLPPPPPSWIQTVRDRFGNYLTFSYSGSLLTQVTSSSGRYVQFAYNANNTVSQAVDNSGRTVKYAYNATGRLSTVTYPDTTTEQYTYDTNGNMLTVVDRNSNTILTNQYDSSQRVSKQTLADGFYLWDYTNGTATNITDPRGAVRHVVLGTGGYPTSVTEAYGTPIAQTTSFIRGIDSQPTSVTDPMGRVTASTYDGLGNLTNRTYLSGTSNAVTYTFVYTNDFNQLESVIDPLGHAITFGYDNRGCLTAVADALFHMTSFSCNTKGQHTSVSDPLGNTTTFGYSGDDLHTVTDPLNRTVTITPDSLGRISTISDPLNYQRKFQYDSNNRVLTQTDPLNQATTFAYYGDGDLKSIKDQNGGLTQWVYDARNRLTVRTDALNQSESWTYDSMGNVLTHTDRKHQTATYQYDLLNRPSLITYNDGSAVTPSFDIGNRLTRLQDSVSGSINFSFDGLNRVYQVQTPQGTVGYSYDNASRRIQMTPANQSAVSYTYDNANRLTSIAQGSENVQFAYDNAGHRTKLTLPNNIATIYSYDSAGQLAGITNQTPAGAQLNALGYTYDSNGRRVSKSGGLVADLLPSSTTGVNSFDLNNRQSQANGVSLSYDLNGSMTSDGTNTYVWDVRNRLTQIMQGATTIASFSYDAIGRRTAKTITGTTTTFLYDGMNPVQETQGSSISTLLTGVGIDERFARDEPAGRRYFLTDGLGSTLALSDSTATIQQTYAYDPYGTVNASGSSNNPYQYTGRETDGTGLYYYRARYYSPLLRRFVSEDPMGLAAGLNEYAYVGQNPLSYSDPSGLATFNGLSSANNPDSLVAWEEGYNPAGYNSVVIHGNSSGQFGGCTGCDLVTAKALAYYLKHSKGYDPKLPTILVACESGSAQGPEKLAGAQAFANALADPSTGPPDTKPVYAPPTNVDPRSYTQGIPPGFVPFYPLRAH